MSKRVFGRFYVALIVLLSLPLVQHSQAQQTLGAIIGTVTDPSEAIVSGANVSLTNNGTGMSRQAVTTNNGSYGFQDLAIGVYTVVVTKEGFDTQNYPSIQVQANRTAR